MSAPGHSAASGTLSKFQEELVTRYNKIIGTLRSSQEKIAKQCQLDLAARMQTFREISADVEKKRQSVFDSMESARESFSELQGKLKVQEEIVNSSAEELRLDAIEIYEEAFQKLQPEVEKAYAACSSFKAELPEYSKGRLEKEVERLNKSFLENKKALIDTLFQIQLNGIANSRKAQEELVSRTNDFNQARFMTLLEETKRKLNPLNPVELDDVLSEFQKKSKPFEKCFQKHVNDLCVIIPPNSFRSSDLDKWWTEYQETMASFENFIEISNQSVIARMQETDDVNAGLMDQIEAELVSLQVDEELANSIADLRKILTVSNQLHKDLQTAISNYWSDRIDMIKAGFTSIREFYCGLIEPYTVYISGTTDMHNKIDEQQKQLRETSTKTLDALEVSLAQKLAEIEILASDKEIDERVKDSKAILGKMEQEYRNFYKNAVAIYDGYPAQIKKLFDVCETSILEKLKVKSLDDATMATSRSTSKSAKKRPAPRKVKSKTGEVEVPELKFRFQLVNELRYEEIEPLKFLPSLEDTSFDSYIAKEAEAKAMSAGKTSSRTQSKTAKRSAAPVRGKKGKVQEPEEPEQPEVNLKTMVPEINGEIGIWVYVPTNDELADNLNAFRHKLVELLHAENDKQMELASRGKELDELITELNERLRIHSPRVSKIEVNIAEGRKRQLGSRQQRLEKYFKSLSESFNVNMRHMIIGLNQMIASLTEQATGFQQYTTDLGKASCKKEFNDLKNKFRIEKDKFDNQYNSVVDDQVEKMQEFVTGLKSSNQRFVESMESSLSNEEKQIWTSSMKKIDSEISTIMESQVAKVKTFKSETQTKLKKLRDDFDLALPHHEHDVYLIDQLEALIRDIGKKYTALIYRNKQSTYELRETVKKIEQTREFQNSANETITLHLDAIDKARIAVINRGRFLNGLKCDLSTDAISSQIDLSALPQSNKHGENDKHGKGRPDSSAVDKRKAGRSSRSSKQRPQTTSQSKKSTAAVSKNSDLSLISQVDALGVELQSKANSVLTEYYGKLKTRKHPITRPDQIAPSASEGLDKIKERWNKIIADLPSINQESIKDTLVIVTDMIESVRDSIPFVYQIISEFYESMTKEQRSSITQNFEKFYEETTAVRKTHTDGLTTKNSDPNNSEAWTKLLDDEKRRASDESNKIQNFRSQMFELEISHAKLYTNNLHTVTALLMELLDSMIFPDDIKCTKQVSERRTNRDLRKENERRHMHTVNAADRAFYIRSWPQIRLTMVPTEEIEHTLLVEKQFMEETSSPSTPSKGDRMKRRRSSQKAVSTVKVEMEPELSSLETPLHRFAIIQRSVSYTAYEQELGNRLNEFRAKIHKLKAAASEFGKYWKSCTTHLGASQTETVLTARDPPQMEPVPAGKHTPVKSRSGSRGGKRGQ